MNYYDEIKECLIKNETYKRIKDYSKNRSDLNTYYEVGKLLSEAGKHYGEGIIKKYSVKLTNELGKKYSARLLYKILKYYYFVLNKKVPTLSANLLWSHYEELLVLKDINEINYYIRITEKQNLSVRKLREKIKSNEYGRLSNKVKQKLINNEETNLGDFIKDPVVIKTSKDIDLNNIKENMLKTLILEDIDNFLKELGDGFSYIESEYKIKLGSTYNYIDLLLYNIKFNAYVVVELKVTELKKEHIGQIEIYMNYIDENIRTPFQNKTIGIIICKENNRFVIKYSSDSRIKSASYRLITEKI